MVTRVLDELEEKGVISPPNDVIVGKSLSISGQIDTRERHVQELLTTERKYVQDLETVQDYMHALQSAEIVSNDVIHSLFLNLNQILDFQRRFLIRMETMYDQKAEDQRFGSLLIAHVSLLWCKGGCNQKADRTRSRNSQYMTIIALISTVPLNLLLSNNPSSPKLIIR